MIQQPSKSNPYAAPDAALVGPGVLLVESEVPAFPPISAVKAAVMSVVSFGIYDLYFWWRHWSAVRDRGVDAGAGVSVFWRTVFAGFMAFDFNERQVHVMTGHQLPVSKWLKAAPGMYLLGLIVDRVSDRMFEGNILIPVTVATAGLRAIALFSTQTGANQVLQAEGYRGPYNRGFSVGAAAVGLLGSLIWAAIAAAALGTFDGVEFE